MKNLKFILLLILNGLMSSVSGQRYFTKSGEISFDGSGKIETIQAQNRSVTCVIDTKSAAIQLAVLMKAFHFEKALMEEHFNENYVESNKYPKAEFKGSIINNADIKYSKDGTYPTTIRGQLVLHGEAKELEATGEVVVKGGKIKIIGEFEILLSDFKVEIPHLVEDNISKMARIKVECNLEPLKI